MAMGLLGEYKLFRSFYIRYCNFRFIMPPGLFFLIKIKHKKLFLIKFFSQYWHYFDAIMTILVAFYSIASTFLSA